MDSKIRDDLNARCELISHLAKEVDKKLKSFPDGHLSIKQRANFCTYYLTGSGTKDRYLNSSDADLISRLAQKSYFEKVLRSSQKELAALQKMQDLYPETLAEDIYGRLSDERKKLVKPIVTPDDQYIQEWLNKPYTPKEIKDNVPVFTTLRGERVRSKSEMIIADRLYTSGIPYKYECPVNVMGKLYHPDFTILKISDRKILYLEHCGRMDDPGYKDDLVTRINDYDQAGIRQGRNLFLTFESSDSPFDVRTLENMISEHFR